MTEKNNYTVKVFASFAALAALLLGCTTGFYEPTRSTAQGNKNENDTVFNAEWIINQQERHEDDETVREGYSIVKAADYFDKAAFAALNAVVVSEMNMNDGYRYFLVRTEADGGEFRAKIRQQSGVLYAQPDFHYDPPSVQENAPSYDSKYRRRGRSAVPFGTGQGNVKQDPEADTK